MKKEIKKNKRVVVAMSGGVDSSVAAYLLKKEGYDVVGIFLKLWQASCYDSCGTKKQNLCCDDKALAVARQIADKLKIPFYVLKVDNLFKKEIVDNFILEYEKGNTPNPCVRCNRYIKFGYLWEKARQLKADYLATGHYVRLSRTKVKSSKLKVQSYGVASRQTIYNNSKKLQATSYKLLRSKDILKDQTYFLSTIDPEVIPHLLFPLGNKTKKEVREIARKAHLPVYNKKDSMGVCFIPDGDNESFLKKYTKKLQKKGQIVDKYGNILGQHKGLLGYTIGKKVGDSEVAARYFKNQKSKIKNQKYSAILSQTILEIPRLYVVSIDPKKNQLIVGENEDCFKKEMMITDWHQVNLQEKLEISKKYNYLIQIRGGHKPEKARIKNHESRIMNKEKKINKILIEFQKPVRAVTPGQTAVVYKKNILIGGGIISN